MGVIEQSAYLTDEGTGATLRVPLTAIEFENRPESDSDGER